MAMATMAMRLVLSPQGCAALPTRHCSFPGVQLSWASSRWPLGRSWLLLAGKYRGPPGTPQATIVVPSLGCWEVMLWSRPWSPRNKTISVPTTLGGQCVRGPTFWAGLSGREKEEQFAWGLRRCLRRAKVMQQT